MAAYEEISAQVPNCRFVFSLPRFLEWKFLSDCAIFLIIAYVYLFELTIFEQLAPGGKHRH